MRDVLPGGDLPGFFERVWGARAVRSWSINDTRATAAADDGDSSSDEGAEGADVLSKLRAGFCDG